METSLLAASVVVAVAAGIAYFVDFVYFVNFVDFANFVHLDFVEWVGFAGGVIGGEVKSASVSLPFVSARSPCCWSEEEGEMIREVPRT